MIKKEYINGVSKDGREKQYQEIEKSKREYKKGKYHERPAIYGFRKKVSSHVIKAKRIYGVDEIKASKKLAKKSKCSLKGLQAIIKRGKGAYYSSGSRPSQTSHSWGRARLASALTGGKSSGVDLGILEKYCHKDSYALKKAQTKKQGMKRVKKLNIGGEVFNPNLTPRQMFKLGSFGGTYWRPIYSDVTKRKYKNVHLDYPRKWWKGIPEGFLISSKYDTNKNKYKVKVGTSLRFWEKKQWITKHHPYGWVQWYCDYSMGKRGLDDKRQIKRWLNIAGPNGRFRKWLVTLIIKNNGRWDDESISPKIRQTLQHWGYKLTQADFMKEKKMRKKQ